MVLLVNTIGASAKHLVICCRGESSLLSDKSCIAKNNKIYSIGMDLLPKANSMLSVQKRFRMRGYAVLVLSDNNNFFSRK